MAKLDPYPSTLTDKEWSLLEASFPPRLLGRPPRYSSRLILNAILGMNGNIGYILTDHIGNTFFQGIMPHF